MKRTQRSRADERNRKLTIREWMTFLVVCSFLTFLNRMTTPHYWWVAWVVAGWGLTLLLKSIFRKFGLYDDE